MSSRVVVAAVAAVALVGVAAPAGARIAGATGTVQVITAPPSVTEDRVESAQVMFGFDERQDALLTAPLALDNGGAPGLVHVGWNARRVTLPAGTRVQSHLIFADPVGRPDATSSFNYSASVTFDNVVIGVALRAATLSATDFLGAPGTRYPSASGVRGLEPGDWFLISQDRHTVSVGLSAHRFDQVRIITAAADEPVVDQAFTTGDDLTANISDCCRFVAQTFTAGLSGRLVGVNVDIRALPTAPRLHVAVRSVSSTGVPSATVLGEVLLPGAEARLSRRITFPAPIPVVAGTSYAIVADYPDAPLHTEVGLWEGASGDAYPRGALLFSVTDGAPWAGLMDTYDVHFRTYVVPA